MAAERALANRHIVSNILRQLSNMKYKVKRQLGPDQPVEFLEFRPTLVPSILVNRIWADEGTSVLWENYPHLPALATMELERRQYYANKVRKIFLISPPVGSPASLEHLRGLEWPNLKSLEMDVDFARHGNQIRSLLHPGLEHVELSGYQNEGAEYIKSSTLPAIFGPCENLQSIRFGPGIVNDEDALDVSCLKAHLEWTPTVKRVEVKEARFTNKDSLFCYLAHRPGLEELEIDLEPGSNLALMFDDFQSPPFQSLKTLTLMCYPEVALSVVKHVSRIENLHLDLCRMPDHPISESDIHILDTLFDQLCHCPRLRQLKVGIGALGVSFPSSTSLLKLQGSSLVRLATNCPDLESINLFAMEPSAIDGSNIPSREFDAFCANLPRLHTFCLKLHPHTAPSLTETALASLAKHCPDLEVLRLKLPFDLTVLEMPDSALTLSSLGTPTQEYPDGDHGLSTPCSNYPVEATPASNRSTPAPAPQEQLEQLSISSAAKQPSSTSKPMLSKLTHLALSRPKTLLATAASIVSSSLGSFSPPIDPLIEETLNPPPRSSIDLLDPITEETLVHDWSLPLIHHFPRLEILEAWGDWTGQDNESLNYFLPNEEILASMWEFLSGVEQDLWDEDPDDEEGDPDANWISYEDEGREVNGYFEGVDLYDDGVYFEETGYPDRAEQQHKIEVQITPPSTEDVAETGKEEKKVDSLIDGVGQHEAGDMTPRQRLRR